MKYSFLLFCFCLIFNILSGQENSVSTEQKLTRLQKEFDDLQHDFDVLKKGIDDILWFNRLSDVAFIDKIFITGPSKTNNKNNTAMGVNNPLKFYSYVFIPKNIDPSKKYPLIVLPHGGVHADFTTYHTHIVKELLAQQYIVIAPEYRGSTGYGKSFYEAIDYGGRENDDVKAARDYMVDNYDIVDSKRVGIIGWSHGGMITLMNIFSHPEAYTVAYAGVPVSDLISRLGYQEKGYADLFSAPYHIGKTINENVEEYKKRSPAWNAEKLKTPLLIHSNTNDDDVNVLEVEMLIKFLKAEGKKFEYEIYKDIEGGHSFDRIDTRIAKEIRLKIYRFLAEYLNPPVRLKSVADIDRAAYRMK